jgi:hypothetical protein
MRCTPSIGLVFHFILLSSIPLVFHSTCLPFHLPSIPFLVLVIFSLPFLVAPLVILSLPFLVAPLVIIGSCFLVYNYS